MWDLNTIQRINQKAAQRARLGLPERDAMFLATGVIDASKPNLKEEDYTETDYTETELPEHQFVSQG